MNKITSLFLKNISFVPSMNYCLHSFYCFVFRSNFQKLFTVAIFFLNGITLVAQIQVPETVLKSPNASGLGSFTEVPVDLANGRPSINLPLYEVKSGLINVPIGLSYNASGVKPDERSGWVGLNWSMNAGGVITRKTNDMPDEYDVEYPVLRRYFYGFTEINQLASFFDTGLTGEQAGYYFNHAVGASTATPAMINNLVANDLDAKDTQPDEFYFNFLNYTGKFFLSENGEWKVQSDDNFKVIFENDFLDLPQGLFATSNDSFLKLAGCYKRGRNLKSFAGFTLIDDNGIQYVFGKSTNAIEYSIPFQTQLIEHWVASSWYLSKIIAPNGDNITFSYQPDNFISSMAVSYFWSVDSPLTEGGNIACALYGNIFGSADDFSVDWINPRFASYAGDLIRPTYLKEIISKHSRVIFNRANSVELDYDLDKVYLKNRGIKDQLVKDGWGSFCRADARSGSFDKDLTWIAWPYLHNAIKNPNNEDVRTDAYAKKMLAALKWKKLTSVEIQSISNPSKQTNFAFNYNDDKSERLFLKSIQKKSNTNTLGGNYFFEYYNDFKLPDYLSEGIDFFGFANGNQVKTLTAPRSDSFINGNAFSVDDYVSRRSPTSDLLIAKSGSLRKITYPTGGTAIFEYEQHTYSKSLNSNNTAIQVNGGFNRTGGLRIKRITSNPIYSPPIINEYFYCTGYTSNSDVNSLPSSGFLKGTPVYNFNLVTNFTGIDVKKMETNIFSSQNLSPVGLNSFGSHVSYSEVVVKRADNSYSKFKYSNFQDERGDHFNENVPVITATTGYLNSSNDLSIERGKLIKEEHYLNSNTIVQSREIFYQKLSNDYVNSLNLDAVGINCGDNLLRRVSAYPYKLYFYKYLPSKEVTTEYSQAGNLSIVRYNNFVYNSRGQVIKIESVDGRQKAKITETKFPTDLQSPELGSNLLITKNIFNQPIYQSVMVENVVINKTENRYSNINGNVLLTSSTHFPTGKTESEKIEYEYNDGGKIKQIKNGSNFTISYLWSYDNSLPVAEIKNSSYQNVLNALNQIGMTESSLFALNDNNLISSSMNLLRNNLLLKESIITSYTHEPLFGITTSTDTNGKTTYYEYDAFGRLVFIRDNDLNILNKFEYNYNLR